MPEQRVGVPPLHQPGAQPGALCIVDGMRCRCQENGNSKTCSADGSKHPQPMRLQPQHTTEHGCAGQGPPSPKLHTYKCNAIARQPNQISAPLTVQRRQHCTTMLADKLPGSKPADSARCNTYAVQERKWGKPALSSSHHGQALTSPQPPRQPHNGSNHTRTHAQVTRRQQPPCAAFHASNALPHVL